MSEQFPPQPPQEFVPFTQDGPPEQFAPNVDAAPVTALSDGEWHRMHPLTPLLKGGLVLIVVIGMVIANLRDRLIGIFVPGYQSGVDVESDWGDYDGDPIDWVVNNNLVVLALIAVLVVMLLTIAGFYLSWRFHTFRITENAVEVRKGILSRSQRRAPLDRVQGVNLTRPFIARLIGLAKLEVAGAGADANVMLEYLSTSKAEGVRSDILTRASGIRQAKPQTQQGADPAAPKSFGGRIAQTVSDGATGILMGAEAPVAPASVVNIPVGRLIGSHIVSGTTVALLGIIIGIVFMAIFASPFALFGLLPALIGLGAFWVGSLLKSLRYSIAPTPDGVRVTFGLTTTVTEIIPPGRVHAIQISQPLLWRPFGWYTLRINRMSGKSAQQQQNGQADPFTTILPVGTWEDARRVLRLMTPELSDDQTAFLLHFGLRKVQGEDPFTTTPRRALLFHPVSWKRNGFFLAPDTLAMRRGRVSRQVALFPLARAQSLTIRQGPLERLFRVGNVQVNAVPGSVNTVLSAIGRDDLLQLFTKAADNAVAAGLADRSHRWAERVELPPMPPVPPIPPVSPLPPVHPNPENGEPQNDA